MEKVVRPTHCAPTEPWISRIDGVVLSVMNEIGSMAGTPDGVNGKPAKKDQRQKRLKKWETFRKEVGFVHWGKASHHDVKKEVPLAVTFGAIFRCARQPGRRWALPTSVQQNRPIIMMMEPSSPHRDPPGDERTRRLETALRRSRKS